MMEDGPLYSKGEEIKHGYIYTIIWECAGRIKEPKQGLCNNLERLE